VLCKGSQLCPTCSLEEAPVLHPRPCFLPSNTEIVHISVKIKDIHKVFFFFFFLVHVSIPPTPVTEETALTATATTEQ